MNAHRNRCRFPSCSLVVSASAVAIVIALSPVAARGQVATATVQGIVTDNTKGVLPGATVAPGEELVEAIRLGSDVTLHCRDAGRPGDR